MEWSKRVCKDQLSGDVLADPAEFYYDIGKRLVLGKEEGMEVNRNVTRGIECLMRAAELGHAAAGWDLQCFAGEPGDHGCLHLDFVKAAQLYQKHVDLGSPMAQSNLGVCYHKGRGIEQNLAKAVDLYKLAAEQGYPRALYNLAVCYDLGEGVEANVEKAVELYYQSAKGGYAVAQYYMGVCFLNGKGLNGDKDPQQAIEMWTRAANQGHAFAQYSLAQSYRDGTGVEKDLLKAASYFVQFTRWGDESGWDCLKNLLGKEMDKTYFPPSNRQRIPPSPGMGITLPLPRLAVPGRLTRSAPSSPSFGTPSRLSSLLRQPQQQHHLPGTPTPSSLHQLLLRQSNAMSAAAANMEPEPEPYIHCFAERKRPKFEENFHVPNLYDLCCLYFHQQWTRNLQNASAESIAEDAINTASGAVGCGYGSSTFGSTEQDRLPAEVRHRIKYENVYCCRPKCRKFFFGQGRVQRTFQLRKGAGGSEREYDDVVLQFCSLECAAFDIAPQVAAGWKDFDPQYRAQLMQQQQQTVAAQ